MFFVNRPLLACVAIFALSGCQSIWHIPDSIDRGPETKVDESPALQGKLFNNTEKQSTELFRPRSSSENNLNISKALSKSISALTKGDTKKARRLLEKVLEKDPTNINAKDFLSQIDTDPVKHFGSDYFTYKARKGDSMTKIADRFLKNHLQFYLLSRYSGIDNPSSLVMGQKVRIPIKYKPQTRSKPVAQKSHGDNGLLDKAKRHFDSANYKEVISTLESNKENVRSSQKAKALLIDAYVKQSQSLESTGDLKLAILYLKKASTLDVQSEDYISHIEKLENKIQAKKLLRLALLHEKSGQFDIAFKNIENTLTLTPDSNDIKTTYRRIKNQLLEDYHAKALRLFEDKHLEDALEIWNKALELEPSHLISKTYRDRCMNILEIQRDINLEYTKR